MDFIPILNNVNKHIKLHQGEINSFTSLLTLKEVPKGKFVLKEGQPCRSISYVHSGILRAYCYDREYHERVVMFAPSDWWVTDIHGFALNKPAQLNIEAIKPSIIFQLHYTDLEKLYLKAPKFERFFRLLMQNSYIREQLRTTQNLTLTAEERYLNFIKKYPIVYQQVPLKQIASYLGITPEFLSLIRKQLKNKIS